MKSKIFQVVTLAILHVVISREIVVDKAVIEQLEELLATPLKKFLGDAFSTAGRFRHEIEHSSIPGYNNRMSSVLSEMKEICDDLWRAKDYIVKNADTDATKELKVFEKAADDSMVFLVRILVEYSDARANAYLKAFENTIGAFKRWATAVKASDIPDLSKHLGVLRLTSILFKKLM